MQKYHNNNYILEVSLHPNYKEIIMVFYLSLHMALSLAVSFNLEIVVSIVSILYSQAMPFLSEFK